MTTATLTPEHRAAAPAAAEGLRVILTGLCALIARAFLKDPRYVAIILPLWNRLNRAARRFDSLMARVVAGTEQPRTRAARPSASGPPPARLPTRKDWLLVALRHEGAYYLHRLEALLATPHTAELIAAVPQAQSILRPICRMLGLRHPAVPNLRRRRKSPQPRPEPAQEANRRRDPPRRDGTSATTGMPHSHVEPLPPFRPLAETVPCDHVCWPWFPGRFSRRH